MTRGRKPGRAARGGLDIVGRSFYLPIELAELLHSLCADLDSTQSDFVFEAITIHIRKHAHMLRDDEVLRRLERIVEDK